MRTLLDFYIRPLSFLRKQESIFGASYFNYRIKVYDETQYKLSLQPIFIQYYNNSIT